VSEEDGGDRPAPRGAGAPKGAPLERYRIAMYGGGIEEIDRDELRERIRRREVTDATEVARAGTDEWRKVSYYPELKGYLNLAATAPAQPAAVRASRAAPAESVRDRVLPALSYPIAGGEILAVIGIAILQSIIGVSLLVIPVVTVYMLAIIRASAEGKTKMPAWIETDDIPAMFSIWLRTIMVTAISLWPMILWYGVWYFTAADRASSQATSRLVAGLIVTGLVSLTYFPACFATIAVWDSVASSLNPAFVFRTIRTLGSDYVIAVVVWVLASVAAVAVGRVSSTLLGSIPFVGDLPRKMLWIWSQFYGSHLLGWAVHRHSTELGWD
jgi:hypothetical protein